MVVLFLMFFVLTKQRQYSIIQLKILHIFSLKMVQNLYICDIFMTETLDTYLLLK